MIAETVLTALLPAVGDGLRGIFNRITGNAGAKPANVNEVIALMEAETSRLKALAEIDAAGNVSQWVANIRAMQRPVAVALIILAYLVAVCGGTPDSAIEGISQYAAMVTFYLFGDRSYAHMKRGK